MPTRQPPALARVRTDPRRGRFKLMMALPFTIILFAWLAAAVQAADMIKGHGI